MKKRKLKLNEWTEKEVEFLQNNYKELKDIEIGDILNIDRVYVKRKRQKLKLKKGKTPLIHKIENIKKEFENRNYILLTDKYKNGKSDLEYICKIHKDKGVLKIRYNNFKQGQGCKYCGIEQSHLKQKHSYEFVLNKFQERNYILISDTYKSAKDLLEYKCKKHINKGIQKIRFYNLLSGYGCPYCGTERMVKKQSKTHIEFLNELNIKYKNEYEILTKYKNINTKIKLKHKECGYIWNVLPSNILYKNQECPKCRNMSKGEKSIDDILTKQLLIFKTQYKFNDCKNIFSLPFDFAIFDKCNNLKFLLEYDGEQHFQGWKREEESLKKIQRNDNIKNIYCKNNNIPLIRIPYWQFDKIEQILDKWLVKYGLLKSNYKKCI